MSKIISEAKERFSGYSLDELLEEISVLPPGQWDNENTNALGEWYAVADDDGIIAYLSTEEEALYYRLDYINRILNS